nr:DUF169 domain-containing protein [candidate division Zixibacteria bacterium]
MDLNLKNKFIQKWEKYFPDAEYPLVFYYTDDKSRGTPIESNEKWHCLIGDLNRVRNGRNAIFESATIGCSGARENLGYPVEERLDFEYFLSCGRAGEIEGIRHKKNPELVRKMQAARPAFKAPDKYIVFKRWDNLDRDDHPVSAIFFAAPDTLAGLFSLANFDEVDLQAVITPSCAGCASIVAYPYLEYQSTHPRSVIGMFDISARPYVDPCHLTFSVSLTKLVVMIDNMDESFLITDRWEKIAGRMRRNRIE